MGDAAKLPSTSALLSLTTALEPMAVALLKVPVVSELPNPRKVLNDPVMYEESTV
jgi:hypothetical protein